MLISFNTKKKKILSTLERIEFNKSNTKVKWRNKKTKQTYKKEKKNWIMFWLTIKRRAKTNAPNRSSRCLPWSISVWGIHKERKKKPMIWISIKLFFCYFHPPYWHCGAMDILTPSNTVFSCSGLLIYCHCTSTSCLLWLFIFYLFIWFDLIHRLARWLSTITFFFCLCVFGFRCICDCFTNNVNFNRISFCRRCFFFHLGFVWIWEYLLGLHG